MNLLKTIRGWISERGVYAALMGIVFLIFVGCGVKIRSLGTIGSLSFALLDDSGNNLLWNSMALVKGNKLDPVFSGKCGSKITSVTLSESGVAKKTVSCVNGNYSLAMTGGSAFTNGIHHLSLSTTPSSIVIEKTYDLFRVNPATMITFNAFPPTTIYTTEDLSGTCNFAASLNVNGTAVSCTASQTFTQSIPVPTGASVVNVTWIDEYGNAGYQDFTITRNPPGTPEIDNGMLSATDSTAIPLTNCAGACGATAPTLSLHEITGTQTGVANQAIPLSIAPSSGATGITLSITNQSYEVCENQDGSGNCIP